MRINVKRSSMALLAISLFLTTGCKDEKDSGAQYASLTVEQNKAKMEDEGAALLTKMDQLKTLDAVYVAKDLSTLMQLNVSVTYVDAPITPLVRLIAGMAGNPQQVYQLRDAVTETNDLKTFMTEYAGVYTYNKSTEQFDKTAKAGEITFMFPTGTSTTNNATVSLTNVTFKTATNQDFSGESLLTSLNFSVQNGSTTLLSCIYSAQCNADDMPSSEATTLTFSEGYKLTETLTNDETNVVGNVAFTYNEASLFSAHLQTKGDFDYAKVKTLFNTENQDLIPEVMNSANVWIQVGNLKMTGQADITSIWKACDAKYPSGWGDENTATEQDLIEIAGIFNANSQLLLLYADGTGVIAKSEFYPYHVQYSNPYFQDDSYDYWTMNQRFVFKDGSAMDESFFNTGFESLQADLEKFKNDLETSYK
ncbi:MAG: hypothetical protein Q8914_07160 [Bacteroidota bacterium]|nr:hypothetical protein [Bacteroidota bacterium]